MEQKKEKFISYKTGKYLMGYSLIGGISNTMEIILLFVLTDILDVYYIVSSATVFILGSIFTFVSRKFLVFKNKDLKKIHTQFMAYIFIFMVGLTLNFFIMTTFVEKFKTHYIVAYIFSVLITGIIGFTWNKMVTFKE